MDYAIDNQTIAQLSRKITISLNASTLTEKDINELNTYQADFSNLEAWHNYYPRPETGLDKRMVSGQKSVVETTRFSLYRPLLLGMRIKEVLFTKDCRHWKRIAA